jgi:hypothetical protein
VRSTLFLGRAARKLGDLDGLQPFFYEKIVTRYIIIKDTVHEIMTA